MKDFNWTKKNTVLVVSVAVYAVLAMLFMIIINNDAISGWIGSVLSVLSPLIIGLAIAYLSNPLLVLFENKAYKNIKNKKSRHALSLVCTYLLIVLALTLIMLIIIPQLIQSYNSFAKNLKSYTDSAITFVNKLIYKLNTLSESHSFSSYINIGVLQKKVSELFTGSSNLLSTLSGYFVNYATSFAIGVKNVIFGFFISIYILGLKDYLLAKCRRFFSAFLSKKKYAQFSGWVKFTHKTFGNYIRAQLLDALLVAVECAIIFSLTGIPYSILLAFIIGVTNVIPVFGPFIGGIPAGFIVFISKPEKLLLFIILIVLIQQVDGNLVLPKLVGTSTGMTSLGVLCAITIMGGYFGIPGMILGVPCFIIIGEIIRHFVNLKLEKKGMSVSLADYYPSGAEIIIDDKNEQKNKNWLVKLVEAIGRFFKKLFHKVASIFKKKDKNNKK